MCRMPLGQVVCWFPSEMMTQVMYVTIVYTEVGLHVEHLYTCGPRSLSSIPILYLKPSRSGRPHLPDPYPDDTTHILHDTLDHRSRPPNSQPTIRPLDPNLPPLFPIRPAASILRVHLPHANPYLIAHKERSKVSIVNCLDLQRWLSVQQALGIGPPQYRQHER